MEHLALEVFDLVGSGSQFANLPPNTTIRIRRTSQIFGSGSVFTQEFTLNVAANAHLFGTAGDIHGSRLHEQINKRKARIWAMGLPLYLGYLRLADEVEVDGDGNVDVTFESGQKTFEDMIEGAKANQVPMIDDVQIGMALKRERTVSYNLKLVATVYGEDEHGNKVILGTGPVQARGLLGDYTDIISFVSDNTNTAQPYPHMVFPKGTFKPAFQSGAAEPVNFLNTDSPYTEDADGTPTNPYCNVALCYQKYGYEKKDASGSLTPDYSGEPEAQRGYEYMPANRVNSAPNFFVLYWIRALMNHLGIYVEENQMLDVEDLRRLFFVNTRCAYEKPSSISGNNEKYGLFEFAGEGRLIPEYVDAQKNIKPSESGFVGKNISGDSEVKSIAVWVSAVQDWIDLQKKIYEEINSYFYNAYATSDCFPNADISEIISAIENGFGVRFLFSDDYKRVRIVLLRNIFRNQDVQDIACEIAGEDVKEENSIRGFRMTYGNTENTEFYYKGFADKLPQKSKLWVDNSDTHDYSHWDLNAKYGEIIRKVTAFDKTCFYTPGNGNAYGIKIDKDAKRYDELHPSLFEYAGYMDAVDGDCSGDENTVKTIEMGFTPAIMNDLNMEQERLGSEDQRFALFVDETMRPRRQDLQTGTDYNDSDAVYDVDKMYSLFGPDGTSTHMVAEGVVKPGEFAITSDMFASKEGLKVSTKPSIYRPEYHEVTFDIDGHINEGYRLYLQDNYEPNDNGISPIETHDWGLTLGIMRGSGSDAYVNYEPDTIENEKPMNDTWDIVAGSSVTAHPDTCDNYGNLWDYNGNLPGDGTSEVVSTPEYAITKLEELFPDSNRNASFNKAGDGYISGANLLTGIPDNEGKMHNILIAVERSETGMIDFGQNYIPDNFVRKSVETMMSNDANGMCIIIEMDSSPERRDTFMDLINMAYGGSTGYMVIDNGVSARYGRFSLKLRAEKPNPYFNPALEENSTTNRRYLEITNKNLRGRGLCDQFYKEYSYWVRNARIVKRTVRMELAQLLSIDDTVRVTVGDVTGYINEMEYDIDMQTGLGNVTMEIMYI